MNTESITLEELRQQICWLPHRDKKPYSAITGNTWSWNEPSAWSNYQSAKAASRESKNVGVVLGDGLICVDLDACLFTDVADGKPVSRVKPRFKSLYELALLHGCYVEISQSGRGLHIFLLSDWQGRVKESLPQSLKSIANDGIVEDVQTGGGVEIYGGRTSDGRATRFIAVTGNTGSCGSATTINRCDEVLQAAFALSANAKAESLALKNGAVPGDSEEVGGSAKIPTSINDAIRSPLVEVNAEEVAVIPAIRKVTPYFVLNKIAVMAADSWFPRLFPGAEKHHDVWRGKTPDASRGDVSLHPTGVRWWKSEDAKTPVDLVMLFADPERELAAAEAVAWLLDQLGLEPAALKGLGTLGARGSHNAPQDIFADGTDVALPWVKGTLPEALEDYAECMSIELGVNHSCMALMFLGVCGASIPAGIRFQPDPAKPGWVLPGTAWAILLAPSGAAKSPVLDEAMKPVYVVQERWAEEHKIRVRNTDDKAEKERLLRQGPNRRVTNASTTEGLLKLMAAQSDGVIVHSDEIAGAFDAIGKYNKGAHGGHSDSQVFLQMYESKSFHLDRKDEGRSLAVERAHGSMIGGVQPAVLAGMAQGLSSNGMLQRFLIGVMSATLYGDPCEDSFGREMYHSVVGHIMRAADFGGVEMTIVGTPELGKAMIAEGNKAREMILHDPMLSDVAKSILGKSTGTLGRISLWLHLIDWALDNRDAVDVLEDDPIEIPSTIGLATFERAARLWWEYCWPTLLHVYDGAGLGSSVVNDMRNVGAYILSHEDKFSQPFTSRAFRGIRTFEGQAGMGRLFAALDALVERNWLRVVDRQGNGAPLYEADGRTWTLFGERVSSAA